MKSKNCIIIAATLIAIAVAAAEEPTTNLLVIHADKPGAQISRNIYGQFSEHLGRCIYDGIWVGEDSPIPNTRGIRNDVVEALKKIKVPLLRWPGGCFADEYHWMDGVGPRGQRASRINTTWGGVVENNQFGTHEFMDFCNQIGAAPYIGGNVGSGTVEELAEWVEYLTAATNSVMSDLRRKNGRGSHGKSPPRHRNESWGCGGEMTPEFYADSFRRYNAFVKNYPGNWIYRIASGANEGDYNWTEVLMKNIGGRMNGLSLHYYTLPRATGRTKVQQPISRRQTGLKRFAARSGWMNSLPITPPSWINMIHRKKSASSWTNGAPGMTLSREPIRSFFTSKTPCATRLWRGSRSIFSTSIATA